jgi:hypothetical protein
MTEPFTRVEMLCRLEAAEEWLRVVTWKARVYARAGNHAAASAWKAIEARNREVVEGLTVDLFDACQDRRHPECEVADLQLTEDYCSYPRELSEYQQIQSGIEAARAIITIIKSGAVQ